MFIFPFLPRKGKKINKIHQLKKIESKTNYKENEKNIILFVTILTTELFKKKLVI